MRHYCTLFDGGYALRGLLMLRSLMRWDPGARVTVLALNDAAARLIREASAIEVWPTDFVRLVSVGCLLPYFPTLPQLRATRSHAEFCWGLASMLLVERLASGDVRQDEAVVYLDADLVFHGDPVTLWDRAAWASVAIVPHQFALEYADRESTSGRYNVAWVMLRNDDAGLACARWWADRCVERCSRETCGDQRYLDEFGARWTGRVCDLDGSGIGLAPWNVHARKLATNGAGIPTADGQEVIYYHLHEWAPTSPFRRTLGYPLSEDAARLIYEPYEAAYREAEARYGGLLK